MTLSSIVSLHRYAPPTNPLAAATGQVIKFVYTPFVFPLIDYIVSSTMNLLWLVEDIV